VIDVAGRAAFVTGGASGLGLAMARSLGRAGARVVLADVDADRVSAAADTLRDEGLEAKGVSLDVTDPASWASAKAEAADFGPVRILVSNAGVGGGSGAFERYDPAVWRWNYDVNAHGHFHACQTFLGEMKASGEPAHLIITASMVALVPPPISVAYISSKFAALGIAMALRNELGGTQVGVSVLCPGMAATRIVETTRALRPTSPESGAAASTAQAMGSVLAAGMDPAAIGEHVVRAIRSEQFYIFTHPEWSPMLRTHFEEMLDAFGEASDPDYLGDDIAGLIAANGGRAFVGARSS
jgi:NAD(P)-dependent dehydrogenase (short-subunit alcohol dehydrogenase family)